MCKYCNNNKKEYIEDYINEVSQHIRIFINENELYFDTNSFVETVKINYCPMCGRLVNKEVLEDIKKSIEDPKCGVDVAVPVCNEIKLDMQEEINKAIEKSMFDISKLDNNFMQGGML